MRQTLARCVAQGIPWLGSRQTYYAALSRCLHEPEARVRSLLAKNRKFLAQVERFRNQRQSHSSLIRHRESFCFGQTREFAALQNRYPGSRILLSYHFGDFVYGNNVVAASEGLARQQCYLTQLVASKAFLSNMQRCFGAEEFQRRERFTTNGMTAMSLVRKLKTQHCTLLTFADLPAGFGETTKVQFLGRDAWFPRGPALIGLASGVPLVPVLNFQDGSRNRIIMHPMIEVNRLGNESSAQACTRITQYLVKILESAVLNYPWQWRFLSSLPAYFQDPNNADRMSPVKPRRINDTGSQPRPQQSATTRHPHSVPA